MASVVVVAVVALVTGLAWLVKPSLFPGAAKRAAQSTQATAQLEAAHTATESAAAASVTAIAHANTLAPESPAKEFIGREAPLALTLLAPPDAQKLLEAERRRAAVMEGRAEEAERLYGTAAKENTQLRRDLAAAQAAREDVDRRLVAAAASEHALRVAAVVLVVIILLVGAAWFWLRLHAIGPESLGKLAASVRAGESPIAALDRLLPERLHAKVQRFAKLHTDLDDPA